MVGDKFKEICKFILAEDVDHDLGEAIISPKKLAVVISKFGFNLTKLRNRFRLDRANSVGFEKYGSDSYIQKDKDGGIGRYWVYKKGRNGSRLVLWSKHPESVAVVEEFFTNHKAYDTWWKKQKGHTLPPKALRLKPSDMLKYKDLQIQVDSEMETLSDEQKIDDENGGINLEDFESGKIDKDEFDFFASQIKEDTLIRKKKVKKLLFSATF